MATIDEAMAAALDAQARAKSNAHRLDNVEAELRDLRELTQAVAVTANNVDRLQSDVTEIKQTVTEMASRPGKRWDAVVGYVLMALASGIVGAVIGIVIR